MAEAVKPNEVWRKHFGGIRLIGFRCSAGTTLAEAVRPENGDIFSLGRHSAVSFWRYCRRYGRLLAVANIWRRRYQTKNGDKTAVYQYRPPGRYFHGRHERRVAVNSCDTKQGGNFGAMLRHHNFWQTLPRTVSPTMLGRFTSDIPVSSYKAFTPSGWSSAGRTVNCSPASSLCPAFRERG